MKLFNIYLSLPKDSELLQHIKIDTWVGVKSVVMQLEEEALPCYSTHSTQAAEAQMREGTASYNSIFYLGVDFVQVVTIKKKKKADVFTLIMGSALPIQVLIRNYHEN